MSAKLLVPLDGSELAEAAVPYAEQVAKALGWDVVLFSAVHQDTDRPIFLPATPLIEAGQDVWERWREHLGEAAEELRHEITAALDSMAGPASHLQAGGLQVEREVGVGEARDAIVRRAAADDVAMIIMASHGRTGLARLVRGSIAAGVVGHTQRPTLVVRPFRDEQQRLAFEHADRLPADQRAAVQQALAAIQS